LKVNRRFGGKYRLHIQGRRINGARNQRESRRQAEGLKVNRRFGGTCHLHFPHATCPYIPEDT
jgi:hypothetical protein